MSKQKIFLIVCFTVFSMIMACFGTASAKNSPDKTKDSKSITLREAVRNAKIPKDEDVTTKDVPTKDSPTKDVPTQDVPVKNLPDYSTGKGVTMLGDSIMSGNRSIILAQLPDAYIDAKGSRNICGGFEAAQKLQWEGKLTDVVIVELGTNGPLLKHEPYASGTQNLLQLLGTERQIYWVTVYCSYSQWMAMNNAYIWELSKTHPNIKVIDWYSLAVQNPQWFPDGVHPNVEGARNFAKLLHDSLAADSGAQQDLNRQ